MDALVVLRTEKLRFLQLLTLQTQPKAAQQSYRIILYLVSPYFDGDYSSDRIPNGTVSFAEVIDKLPMCTNLTFSIVMILPLCIKLMSLSKEFKRVEFLRSCIGHASTLLHRKVRTKNESRNSRHYKVRLAQLWI